MADSWMGYMREEYFVQVAQVQHGGPVPFTHVPTNSCSSQSSEGFCLSSVTKVEFLKENPGNVKKLQKL